MRFKEIVTEALGLIRSTSILKKSDYIVLIFLTLSASLLEIVSVGAIVPFTHTILDIDGVKINVSQYSNVLNALNDNQIRSVICSLFVAVLVISAAVRLILLWYQIKLSYRIAHTLNMNIFERTIREPYANNSDRSSSEFIAAVSMKANLVTRQIILPGFQMLTGISIVVGLMLGLAFIDFRILFIILSIYLIVYFTVIKFSKDKVKKNGKVISQNSTNIIKIMQETFNSIKEIKIANRVRYQLKEFKGVDLALKAAQGSSQLIGAAPRFLIELVGLSLIAIMVTIYSISGNVEPTTLLGTIAAFALGFQKITPNIQNMYNQYVTIMSGGETLRDTAAFLKLEQEPDYAIAEGLDYRENISLKKVSLTRGANKILSDLNLVVPSGAKIGISGDSGAGKTTLLDLLSSLITPTTGDFSVDNQIINETNFVLWREKIAYVDQRSYFYDDSLLYNITLKNDLNECELNRLDDILDTTRLLDVTIKLGGLTSNIGENGRRLSGGQKQRVSIARALFQNKEVLFLDEATNALDKETEKIIIDNIFEKYSSTTIFIISHDKDNFRYCDEIIQL